MVRKHARAAFTLVELLVVIGVIGLLLSILLPALAKSRRAANELVCESNLRQFGIGLQEYADQNKGLLPQKGPDGTDQATNCFGPPALGAKNQSTVKGFDDPSIWFNALPPLVNNHTYYQNLVDDYHHINVLPYGGGPPSIFICPEMSSAGTMNGNDILDGNYFLLYGTDSTGTIRNNTGLKLLGQFRFDLTYVWNSKLASTITPTSPPGATTNLKEAPVLKMSWLRPASECVVMVEKLGNPQEYQDPTVQAYNNTYTINGGPFQGVITPQGYNSNIAQSKADWRRFTTRHRHGGHLLFADGHVDWFSWTQVQIQPDQMPNNVYKKLLSDANQPGFIRWSALGPVN
jgi:prepilin-type N-terminal cleavage/methylation domain-containing protein/prepilin-type processing-associated H-X9-DG protein